MLHGTADDNVHFQNAARLAAAFQKQNKRFHTMFYPGKKHGLEGVSRHVYTTITDFVVRYL
jgi:dipeptidyl-peptidase-4